MFTSLISIIVTIYSAPVQRSLQPEPLEQHDWSQRVLQLDATLSSRKDFFYLMAGWDSEHFHELEKTDIRKLQLQFHPDKRAGIESELQSFGILPQCEIAVRLLNSIDDVSAFYSNRNELRSLRGLEPDSPPPNANGIMSPQDEHIKRRMQERAAREQQKNEWHQEFYLQEKVRWDSVRRSLQDEELTRRKNIQRSNPTPPNFDSITPDPTPLSWPWQPIHQTSSNLLNKILRKAGKGEDHYPPPKSLVTAYERHQQEEDTLNKGDMIENKQKLIKYGFDQDIARAALLKYDNNLVHAFNHLSNHLYNIQRTPPQKDLVVNDVVKILFDAHDAIKHDGPRERLGSVIEISPHGEKNYLVRIPPYKMPNEGEIHQLHDAENYFSLPPHHYTKQTDQLNLISMNKITEEKFPPYYEVESDQPWYGLYSRIQLEYHAHVIGIFDEVYYEFDEEGNSLFGEVDLAYVDTVEHRQSEHQYHWEQTQSGTMRFFGNKPLPRTPLPTSSYLGSISLIHQTTNPYTSNNIAIPDPYSFSWEKDYKHLPKFMTDWSYMHGVRGVCTLSSYFEKRGRVVGLPAIVEESGIITLEDQEGDQAPLISRFVYKDILIEEDLPDARKIEYVRTGRVPAVNDVVELRGITGISGVFEILPEGTQGVVIDLLDPNVEPSSLGRRHKRYVNSLRNRAAEYISRGEEEVTIGVPDTRAKLKKILPSRAYKFLVLIHFNNNIIVNPLKYHEIKHIHTPALLNIGDEVQCLFNIPHMHEAALQNFDVIRKQRNNLYLSSTHVSKDPEHSNLICSKWSKYPDVEENIDESIPLYYEVNFCPLPHNVKKPSLLDHNPNQNPLPDSTYTESQEIPPMDILLPKGSVGIIKEVFPDTKNLGQYKYLVAFPREKKLIDRWRGVQNEVPFVFKDLQSEEGPSISAYLVMNRYQLATVD